MCGRYTLTADPEAVARRFGLAALPPGLARRYNIAPSQPALVVVGPALPMAGESGAAVGRRGFAMRWGLEPAWAGAGLRKGPAERGARRKGRRGGFINARAETAAERPAFRGALRHRRCLVPADGFYEWRKEGGRRVPYYVRLRDGEPFAFAGIWEVGPGGEPGFAILTTAANDRLRPLHDRMPVILPREAEEAWLDPSLDPGELGCLLVPFPGEAMEAYRVSPLVNSPRHDGPGCIAPA